LGCVIVQWGRRHTIYTCTIGIKRFVTRTCLNWLTDQIIDIGTGIKYYPVEASVEIGAIVGYSGYDWHNWSINCALVSGWIK